MGTATAEGPMTAFWTIITRHPSHAPGKWTLLGGAVYETREQAVEAAREAWAGTDVRWRLMSIPIDDDEQTG